MFWVWQWILQPNDICYYSPTGSDQKFEPNLQLAGLVFRPLQALLKPQRLRGSASNPAAPAASAEANDEDDGPTELSWELKSVDEQSPPKGPKLPKGKGQ